MSRTQRLGLHPRLGWVFLCYAFLGIVGAALGLIGVICWAALGGSLSMFGNELMEAVESSM